MGDTEEFRDVSRLGVYYVNKGNILILFNFIPLSHFFELSRS